MKRKNHIHAKMRPAPDRPHETRQEPLGCTAWPDCHTCVARYQCYPRLSGHSRVSMLSDAAQKPFKDHTYLTSIPTGVKTPTTTLQTHQTHRNALEHSARRTRQNACGVYLFHSSCRWSPRRQGPSSVSLPIVSCASSNSLPIVASSNDPRMY